MVNRIGTVYPCGSNKGLSLKFCVDSRAQHETPEEGQRIYRPKHCDYNNKDEVNGPNILTNNNYQTSPLKFRQIIFRLECLKKEKRKIIIAIFLSLYIRSLLKR